MKNTTRLIATVVLSMLVATVSAQVKQVFQVFDYDTQKPLAGVTNVLFGQTFTTNAQGVAVANMPADKKGAFLPLEEWALDGYYYMGRTPASKYRLCQSNDTIKCYMVSMSKYRQAVDQTFEQLYRFSYDNEVKPVVARFAEDSKTYPDKAVTMCSNLVEASMSRDPVVKSCYLDAKVINMYDMDDYNDPKFDEVKQVLATGDVNKATAMAKSHIDLADNSRSNLEWIDFYRDMRDLEASTEDEDPISDYSEILYKNHYTPFCNVYYVQDLSRNGFYEKADSVCTIEKPNSPTPRHKPSFEPSFFRYIFKEENPAKLKMLSENLLDVTKKVYREMPYSVTLGDVAWCYKNSYLAYAALEDSVLASRALDSAIYYKQKSSETSRADAFDKKQQDILFDQYLLDVINFKPAYASDSKVYQLYDEIYNLSKENYLTDTSSLFLKMQLAENALVWLQKAPQVEGYEEKHLEVLRQLTDVNFSLSKDFPEFYAVQNVQVSSQLVGACLMAECTTEQMQEAFGKYEHTFDIINALYPKVFVDVYLRYNRMLDGYLAASQMFVLSSEISDFSDRLLNVKAGNDPQLFLEKKAEYFNETAESLYQSEMYEESIAYYLQSCELYKKAMPKNDSLWIPYLTNYLQMGDAHLYQNQYDKALMTYQQILDFEPQIPASIMPQYTSMKGSAHYYIADVYRAMDDVSRAEKEYKTAEKFFKKAISMGDANTAGPSMGEMYWGKAVRYAQQEDMKKCRQMTEKAVSYYELASLDRPLKRYAQAKAVMGEFYKQEQNAESYYKTIRELEEYYKKFAEYDVENAAGMVENAEIMLKSGAITNEEALTYSYDVINGLVALNDAGEDVQLPYLRAVYNLARAYTANDSVLRAIELYRNCLDMNEVMFKDTAVDSYNGNRIEVYAKIANCYELMAEEIDTAHSDLWYYRAIDTRDTLINLLKELSNDGDVNMTYRTATQYRNNGIVYYHLEMVPSALDCFDKSNELLQMLYNSEYKTEVEDDVIRNYHYKGIVYSENNNTEKAIENFRTAVEYGDKSDLSQGVGRYYYFAVLSLIEQLEKDPATNSSEIASLKKKQKQLEKLFK